MQEIDGIGPYGYASDEEVAYADGKQAGLEIAIEIIKMLEESDSTVSLDDFFYGKMSVIVDSYNWKDFAEEVKKQDTTLRWANGKDLLWWEPVEPGAKFAITVIRTVSGSRYVQATPYDPTTVKTEYHIYKPYDEIE